MPRVLTGVAARSLDYLQWLPALVAVVLSFRGRGRHRDWVILALALPLFRVALSPSFRVRVKTRVAACRAAILNYAMDGTRVPWGAVFLLVVMPAALFYLASGSVPGVANGDTSPVVPTAVQFVRHGNYRLDAHVGDPCSSMAIPAEGPLPYYVRRTESGLYSNYPAGMTTFAIPVVAVSQVLGADWNRPATPGRIEKWTGAWLAAASLGLFFLICLRLAPPGPAVVCTILLGAASSLFSTASQDLSQQGGVVFWTLVLLWIEIHYAGRPSTTGTLVQALACGCALTCRISAVLVVGSFLAWVLVRSPKRAVVTGLLAAVAFAPWGWFYWTVYHSLLGPSETQTQGAAWAAVPGQHLFAVLFSPGRGLFVYHPWLAVLAIRPWTGGRELGRALRGWRVFLIVACVLHTLLVASWGMWWGGYSWGPRLMTETVPPLGLLALAPLARLWAQPVARKLIVLLGVAGLWMHVAGTYLDGLRWNAVPADVDTHPERLWDWREPPFAFPLAAPALLPPSTPEGG